MICEHELIVKKQQHYRDDLNYIQMEMTSQVQDVVVPQAPVAAQDLLIQPTPRVDMGTLSDCRVNVESLEKRIKTTRKLIRSYWRKMRSHLMYLNSDQMSKTLLVIKHLQKNLNVLQVEYFAALNELSLLFVNFRDQIINEQIDKKYIKVLDAHAIHINKFIELTEANKMREVNLTYLNALHERASISEVQYLYYHYLNLSDNTVNFKHQKSTIDLLSYLNTLLCRLMKGHFSEYRDLLARAV
jgi:hypothetical protein